MIEISRGIRTIREKSDGADGSRPNDGTGSDALLSAVVEAAPAVAEGGKKKRKKDDGDEKKAPRPRSFYNDFVASKMAELKQSVRTLHKRKFIFVPEWDKLHFVHIDRRSELVPECLA